jgi:hypothetical protein
MRAGLCTAAVIALVLTAGSVGAQQPAFVTEAVLINPGARSIALGGAFAAVADDATAALANPAGLVQIARPEISAEIRGTVSTEDTELPFERDSGISGLGFFSFTYPGKSWAAAVYTHQLASLDFTFEELDPLTRELTVQGYSAAIGLQISERLSLGAGGSYYDADFGSGSAAGGGSDTSSGFNFGILWTAFRHFKVAGFYRQGPEFETGSSAFLPPDPLSSGSVLAFPDVYGAAVAYQPGGGGLTLGFEVDRIGSSTEPLGTGSLVSDGGAEIHAGVEYAILEWNPVVAFRAGLWRDPGGEVQTVERAAVTSTHTGTSATHLAVGFGFAFSRFQLDLGADFSDRNVVGSLSMVIGF